ncbi:MAG: hypothetical protein KBF88_02360 [Polyangiaceae bacterium]|nr:hypothetical protein [Polyangiaceae bacterium]
MIEPLAPELKSLFDEERSSHPDRSELRTRVLTKVETSIALGAGVVVLGAAAQGITATGSGAALSPLASFGVVKVAIVSFVVGGLLGGSTVAIVDRTRARENRVEVPTDRGRNQGGTISRVAPPPPSLEAPSLEAPSIEPAPVRSPPIAVPAPKQSASAALQDREIESTWLAEGNNALLRGNGDEALTWVAKHKTSYPEGALREEREILAIQALVSSNRREEASQRAAQFRLRFAKSARMAAVEAALREKP